MLEKADKDEYAEESVEVVTILKGVTPETHVKTGDVITLNDSQAKTIANTTIEKVTKTENGTNGGTVTVSADSSTEIYVYYKRNKFNLTVTAGENTKNTTGTGSYKWGQIVDISAETEGLPGYTYSNFAWTVEPASDVITNTSALATKVTMPAQNITVTSRKTPNKYKVTLDNQGAVTPGTSEYYYKYKTQLAPNIYYYFDEAMTESPMTGSKIEKPTKTGYTFNGYYLNKNGKGTQYVDKNGICINNIYANRTEDTTLYAYWTENLYTINYVLNDGIVEGTNPTGYTVNSNNITLKNPTKVGYTFTGWTGTDLSEPTTTVTIPKGSTGNREYTANWTANIYKVTLNNGNADVAGTEEYYYQYNTLVNGNTLYYTTSDLTTSFWDDTKGGNYIVLPSKTGYTFNGYYTEENGNGKKYVDETGHTVNNINKLPNDTTLYAYWTINNYLVTYDYGTNGGQKSSSNTDVTEGVTLPYSSNIDLTKTGYKANSIFIGWNTDATASTKIDNLAVGTSDVTLYAIYANMEVSDSNLTIDLSDTEHLTKTITVTGSNYGTPAYTSSDSTVATVTADAENANQATITALKPGTATITVTSSAKDTEGNPITKQITVKVIKTPTGVTVSPASTIIGTKTGYNTTTLTATIEPTGTTEQNTVTWSSNNTQIATVNATTGLVTGVKEGTTIITATTANGITNTAEVIVDSTAPTITVAMDNKDYKKSHTATITITDEVAGLPASQTIKYGWSSSSTTAPTTWQEKTISVTEGTKTASTTVTKNNDSGIYYLWVQSGAKDRLNNATTSNFVASNTDLRALMDNTKPTIALKSGETANLSKANPASIIIIPLTVTDTHSGMNTGTTADAFTAEDIVVKVNGEVVNPTTKELTYVSVANKVYTYSLKLSGKCILFIEVFISFLLICMLV